MNTQGRASKKYYLTVSFESEFKFQILLWLLNVVALKYLIVVVVVSCDCGRPKLPLILFAALYFNALFSINNPGQETFFRRRNFLA